MDLKHDIEVNYDRLRKMTINIAYGNIEVGEDLLHNSIVRMLENKGGYREKHFFAWVYVIAKNLWKNYNRDLAKRGEIAQDGYRYHMEAKLENREFNPNTHFSNELVQNSLDLLSKVQRETVELYNEGYEHEEIGYILDIPEGTVKSRLHYSIKILKGALNEY